MSFFQKTRRKGLQCSCDFARKRVARLSYFNAGPKTSILRKDVSFNELVEQWNRENRVRAQKIEARRSRKVAQGKYVPKPPVKYKALDFIPLDRTSSRGQVLVARSFLQLSESVASLCTRQKLYLVGQ